MGTIAAIIAGLVSLVGGGGFFAWARKQEAKLGAVIQALEDEVKARQVAERAMEKEQAAMKARMDENLRAETQARREAEDRVDRYVRDSEKRFQDMIQNMEVRIGKETHVLFAKVDNQSEAFNGMAREFSELKGACRACNGLDNGRSKS